MSSHRQITSNLISARDSPNTKRPRQSSANHTRFVMTSKLCKITSPSVQNSPHRTLANGKARRPKQKSTKAMARLSMQQTRCALCDKTKSKKGNLVYSIRRLAMLEATLNQNQIETIAREQLCCKCRVADTKLDQDESSKLICGDKRSYATYCGRSCYGE